MKQRKMSDTNIKIMKFSGEREDWKLWSEVFKAKLMANDLLEVIEMKAIEIPGKDADVSKADVKKLLKKNKMAYLEMISNIDMRKKKGRMAMNMIMSTKTEEHPNGNSALAWHKLNRKYSPNTSAEMSRVKSCSKSSKITVSGTIVV